ncbi:50S ribosomal protein L2 [Candidatus Dependentiae bacterium]|nr:50S ribosomal protein L2 [Candidatus Dependentiae bacterium]
MAIITRKPRNSSLRFQTFIDNSDITTTKPERSLVRGMKKTGGRNAYGRITMRHKGGGAYQKYRSKDEFLGERDVEGKVVSIEYDPNRNVRIGLIIYVNGTKRYILMPEGLEVGNKIISGEQVEAKVGNCLPLRSIPVGFVIHNVEIKPGSGGKLARSAGSSIRLVAKADEYATLQMPSGEIRMIHLDCWATIGVLGNADFKNISWGKAGRTRNRGIRPTVRGMAMNPIDHPHGGGEGRSKSGSHPMTPWGKGCKGTRTRKRKSDLIIKRRRP